MDRAAFQAMMKEDFDTIVGINTVKGHDYAGDEDALANFKETAKATGITPEQAWSVFATKHWSAIMTFVREGDVASEPIEGRIHDVILYSFLLLGLIREKEAAKPQASQSLVEQWGEALPPAQEQPADPQPAVQTPQGVQVN